MEFDPNRDAENLRKHGVSLSRAADLIDVTVVLDERFTVETRYRAYGILDGLPHCLAFTFRDGEVRAINLRRAHLKEYRKHVRR